MEIGDVSQVKWVPVAVALKMLGVSKQRVHALLKKGKLAGIRVEGTPLVSVSSIQDRIRLLREVRRNERDTDRRA